MEPRGELRSAGEHTQGRAQPSGCLVVKRHGGQRSDGWCVGFRDRPTVLVDYLHLSLFLNDAVVMPGPSALHARPFWAAEMQ